MNLTKLFSATSPVPYAISAAVITLLATLGGYLYYKTMQRKLQCKIEEIGNKTREVSAPIQKADEDTGKVVMHLLTCSFTLLSILKNTNKLVRHV